MTMIGDTIILIIATLALFGPSDSRKYKVLPTARLARRESIETGLSEWAL